MAAPAPAIDSTFQPAWRWKGLKSTCSLFKSTSLLATQETEFDSWVKTIPWRRILELTPVFLPGKFHGQRSLADYSPWGHRVRHDCDWTHIHRNYTDYFVLMFHWTELSCMCTFCYKGAGKCSLYSSSNLWVLLLRKKRRMHVGKPLRSLPQFCCLLATITAWKSIPDFLLGCRFLQPGAVSFTS